MPEITEEDVQTIEDAAHAAMRGREYQTAIRAYALSLRLRVDLKKAPSVDPEPETVFTIEDLREIYDEVQAERAAEQGR